MKRFKYICIAVATACFMTVQTVIALGNTSEWTDKPVIKDYKVGQRVIVKVRDAFLNSTEQEVFQFEYEGKKYVNINGKNPVVVSHKDAENKKKLLLDAMNLYNELEKKNAEKEGRNPLLKDLNSLKEDDFIIEVSNKNIATFDESGNLKITGRGSLYITFEEKGTNKIYVYFMEASGGVNRIAGANRVDTALEIAKATFKGKVRNVVLATADNYPDALAGSVLANKIEAPILLVGSSNDDVEKLLSYMSEKLEPSGNVYILGGNGAVKKEVEQSVKNKGFENVKRLSGIDRYATAASIANNLKVKEGTPVVIAYGESYADALSISSTASVNQYPILLVEKDRIPEEAKKMLSTIKPSKVFIVGLQNAVGEKVEKDLAEILNADKSKIARIGGLDRYATSIEIAKFFDLNGKSAAIATGNDFPDALAGSTYAAKFKAPLILSDKVLSENAKEYLKNKKVIDIAIFGGESVVNKNVENELMKIIE